MIVSGNFINKYRILRKVADSSLSTTYVADKFVDPTPVLLTLWHGIQLTTSEDTQTFQKKARHGVIFKDPERIPLLDAQLYHQSPYIVVAFNKKASSTLNAHTKFVDQAVTNRQVLRPDDPHSSTDAFLSVFCISPNKITFFDANTLFANNALSQTASPVETELKQLVPKPKGRRIYRGVAVMVLLVLTFTFIALLTPVLPLSAATVTITPESQRITHTYPITLVSGDPSAGQIREYTTSYTTPPQSQTVPTTGKGHHDATQAQGQVVISQILLFSASYSNSMASLGAIQASDGTMISIDAFTATEGGTVTVNANASTAGQAGNIPANDINNEYNIYQVDQSGNQGAQIGIAFVQNPNAFTGGQDSSDYAYVEQQDIDGIASIISAQLMLSAQKQAQQQLKSGDQLVDDIACTDSVTTDHQVQDIADSVTVTVQVTCTGNFYKQQDLRTAAINAQTATEIAQFGQGYQPSGDITTGPPSRDTSSQTGSIVYDVPTDGIWVFQIDTAQQRQLAQSIAGKSQQDAINQLLQHKGIKSVAITTFGIIGTVLPTSPARIQFTIVHIPGLTSH